MSKFILFLLGAAVGAGGWHVFTMLPVEPAVSGPLEAGTPATAVTAETSQPELPPAEQIQALEERLAVRDREVQTLRTAMQQAQQGGAVVVPDVIRAAEPEDRMSWLENLQANDPERYQEIMQRREEARQTARYELAKRAAHFLFREDELATDEDVEEHQRMMALLQQSIDLTERMEAGLPEEERREMSRTIRRNMRDLAPLLENERDRELYRIGKDIGYSDDDAAAFALYIRDVIDLTSVRSIFRNTMRGPGGEGMRDGAGGPGPEGR